MQREDANTMRIVRRLVAAEGYLDLDLPNHALDELKAVGHPGPFEPVVDLLTGEAFKGQKRYRDAIGPLTRAAEMIPPPHNRQAWLSLSECFRLGGNEEMAEEIKEFANSPARQSGMAVLKISISIEQAPCDEGDEG